MVFFVALCSSCDQFYRPVFSEANAQAVSKCSWQGGSSILFLEDQYNKYPCFSLIQKVFIFFPDLYSSFAEPWKENNFLFCHGMWPNIVILVVGWRVLFLPWPTKQEPGSAFFIVMICVTLWVDVDNYQLAQKWPTWHDWNIYLLEQWGSMLPFFFLLLLVILSRELRCWTA